jgi:ketosteroid isomerase-like protein
MHPNVEKYSRALEAFGTGDVATLAAEHFAPDIVWHLAGTSSLAGTYKGQEEVFGFLGLLAELTGGTFTTEPHAILGDDDHVVLLTRTKGERPDGRRLDVRESLVTHVVKGRQTEVWHSQFDADAWDEFWS